MASASWCRYLRDPGPFRWLQLSIRSPAARAEQRNVHPLEALGSQLADRNVRTLELQLLPRAPGAGEQNELAHGKPAALEALDHFDAHGAGGSCDGYCLGHFLGRGLRN